MKASKSKLIIALPLITFALPLIAASCNISGNKQGMDTKHETEFDKIDYPAEISYFNLAMILFMYEVFGPEFHNGKSFEVPISLDETKKILQKLIKQDPENKEALENGKEFFTRFFEHKKSPEDHESLENLINPYPMFRDLIQPKKEYFINKFFTLDNENGEKDKTFINPFREMLDFLLHDKEIKYYNYLTLVFLEMLFKMFSLEGERRTDRSTIETKKRLKLLDSFFRNKTGFSRAELINFFNTLIKEFDDTNNKN
ncbi:hypothetical protein HGG64_01565 [Mycoplasma phocoeninasale]|uniref:Lipoprotein n=1 Tax=Mycoplasma phocoeninasale TaxID=2726117 RepID=A0A858U563_9MOLU|nr:hypothetical protein [Mycoplasma phocoeninasale]QJG66395.1 hypothetical protein HGG64_01565 [Mycoplasma phocoeninasale]